MKGKLFYINHKNQGCGSTGEKEKGAYGKGEVVGRFLMGEIGKDVKAQDTSLLT